MTKKTPGTYTLKGGSKDLPPNDNRGQMLNRASLALATLASKADDQPSLCVLRITPEETIATNGIFLGRVTHPVVDRHAVTVNAPVEIVNRAITPCSIPRDVALDLAKLIPESTAEDPHHYAFLDLDEKIGGKLRVLVRQPDALQQVDIGEVQLEFPAVNAVMPKKRGALHFAINRKLLDVVLGAARRMGLDSQLQVYIQDEPESPILIEGKIEDTEQHAQFVIMPMRSTETLQKKRAANEAGAELIPRACVYCKCTDERACEPPCRWVGAQDAGGRDVCDAKKCLDKLGRELAKGRR